MDDFYVYSPLIYILKSKINYAKTNFTSYCIHLYRPFIHLCVGYYSKSKLMIHKTCSHLREVALVRNQTTSSKATGAADFVHPFCPFWIQVSVWFLIFRFENPNFFLKRQFCTVHIRQWYIYDSSPKCANQNMTHLIEDMYWKMLLDGVRLAPQQYIKSLHNYCMVTNYFNLFFLFLEIMLWLDIR